MESASSRAQPGQPPVRFCPCGLTREKVKKFNKIDEDLFCTAIRRGSTTREKCGELLADHPRDSDLPLLVIYTEPQQRAGKLTLSC
jgi:cytidine deaminase